MILEFLKKYEKQSIIISILLVLVAIFLIAKPGIALSTAVTLFATVFIVDGVINIVAYIMEEQQVKAFSSELIIGILLVILGLIILFNQPLFISMLPIMIGTWIFIKSIRVKTGPIGHAQNRARIRVHQDDRRTGGFRILHRLIQRILQHKLDLAVQGQID